MSNTHIYEKTILEHHLDTLGHVNNATYISLFEEARWQLITENNYGIEEVHKRKKSPVVLSIDIKFVAELRNREKIKIETYLIDYPSKIGKLGQKIYKEDGKLSCEAVFVFGLFDLNTRKLIEPTPEWKRAIGMEA